MTLPRIDLMLKDSRIASLQRDYGDDYGIDDEFFLVAANLASLKIQRYLVLQVEEPFATFDVIDATDGHPLALPSDLFAHKLIYSVEYSADGTLANYEELTRMSNRTGELAGYPEEYLVTPDGIYLDKVPTSGTFRIRYEGLMGRLDKRRGTIESSSNVLSGSTKTIVVVDGTQDATKLAATEFICVVDRAGTILLRNLPVSSYDASTRTITIYDDFVPESGETIPNGSYIVAGRDVSTHSRLPDLCEDFFVQFIAQQVAMLLSSTDEDDAESAADAILQEIAEVFAQAPGGHSPIFETRGEY